ncbi:MAG: oligosaccharide flippase family protein [Clostridiales bacterium]|nr:MAG: oligosaccharide flippase family protein [Clostridiales bacterium]
MRSAATMKNSIWGILSQIVVCVLSLFSRRVMIDTIGVEGVGLNAFLTSIITMLSLAELGIGTAIVYHMYLPLANGDTVQIKRLMNFYKTVYRAIAAAILVLGLILLPFMPKMAGDTSYSKRIYFAYFSYCFYCKQLRRIFTYKRSLLSADQKQYVITLFRFGIQNFFTVVLGIAVLKLTHELAYYLILLIISTVGENVFLSKKVDKMYPYILEKSEKLPKKECIEIARDVKNIFVAKLSAVVTTSTDSILINVMVGTVQTGLYSNYNIILSTLSSALNQFASSMRGSIGNLVASETKRAYRTSFKPSAFYNVSYRQFLRVLFNGAYRPVYSACVRQKSHARPSYRLCLHFLIFI